MENAKTYAVPLGRLLMSSLFIWAGWEKLFKFGPTGTAGYFATKHIPIPDVAAWVVIVIELIGGLMLLVGFQTRWVALVRAGHRPGGLIKTPPPRRSAALCPRHATAGDRRL